MAIILPSQFTGGTMNLSYQGLSKVVNGSSNHSITVASWYTEVTCEVKTVTSGVRIALVYQLTYTKEVVLPSLAAMQEVTRSLEGPLASWGSTVYTGPQKSVHFLDHDYPVDILKSNALAGKDALRVQALVPVATRHGFRVILGSLVRHICGASKRIGSGFQDPDSATRTTSLVSLMDLEGTPLCEELPVTKEDPDRSDYDSFVMNLANSLEVGEPTKEGRRGEVRLIVHNTRSLSNYFVT